MRDGRGDDAQRNHEGLSVKMHNVEVTGAARLYRAASVWTAGLCLTGPPDVHSALMLCSQRFYAWLKARIVVGHHHRVLGSRNTLGAV